MSDRDERRGNRSAVVVRSYRDGDGDRLRALWIEARFRFIGDDDDGLARFAARNPGTFLVAEDGDQIVASAMGGWDGRRGWIYHVATAAEYQGRGIATSLVGRIEAALRGLGCPRCLVIVENSNKAAFDFWRGLGYERRDTAQLGTSL